MQILLLSILYLIFPYIGYVQYRKLKKQGLFPGYTFHLKDLRSFQNVPEPIMLIRSGFWALVIALVSIIPLLGLPGGFVLELVQSFHLFPNHEITGDEVWPAAIILSLILPLAWPLSVFSARYVKNYIKLQPKAYFLLIFLFWLVLNVYILYTLF